MVLSHNSQRNGFSVPELLAVLAIATIVLSISLPALQNAYLRSQIQGGEMLVSGMVQQARMSALKEKVRYRLVFHDQGASTPNRIEFQREVGGVFVQVASESRDVPSAVRILGSTPYDSMNSLTVSGRGSCSSGTIFLSAGVQASGMGRVEIASTCFASTS